MQFNVLKNLWLKRNLNNILTAEKLQYNRIFTPYQYGTREYYEDTFFSYLDSVQLYLYTVKIDDQKYSLFCDRVWSNYVSKNRSCTYARQLPEIEKKSIDHSFGILVPIVEHGAASFWRKYWSKQTNSLQL